jgi:ubiquinone biosynthesis protein
VLERLAAFGFTRGPHRLVRDDHTGESLGLKLRLALSELGPVFSSFGRYLATRVDLLTATDCLELEALTDHAPPMSYAEVRQLIERAIGCAPEEAFLNFETDCFESHLLYQLHRASLLESGRPMVVKLVRPEVAQLLLCDLELLESIALVIGGPKRTALYKTAVGDFGVVLRQQIDLTHEATALETLRRDVEDFEFLRVPEVLHNLSATSMLTSEELSWIRKAWPDCIARYGCDRPCWATSFRSSRLRQTLSLSRIGRSLLLAAFSPVFRLSRNQTYGNI